MLSIPESPQALNRRFRGCGSAGRAVASTLAAAVCVAWLGYASVAGDVNRAQASLPQYYRGDTSVQTQHPQLLALRGAVAAQVSHRQPLVQRRGRRGGRVGVASALMERTDAQELEYDLRLVQDSPSSVLEHLKARRASDDVLDTVKTIGSLNERRRQLIQERDAALNTRKTLSAEIGQLMRKGESEGVDGLKELVESANQNAANAEQQLAEVMAECSSLFAALPNLLDSRVPDGDNEEANQEILTWGDEFKKTGENMKWHDELALNIGGYCPEAAIRTSGARMSVLRGPLAKLERAISAFMIDMHVEKHGYTEHSVPYLVCRSVLEGTGQLPKFEDGLFQTNHDIMNEDSFLIPTAEVPLTGMYRDQILEESELPISLVAHTPCFRSESDSGGRDTKGLLRQHQFHKVELVRICATGESNDLHEQMTKHSENVLQALKLPYRKIRLCSGDIGFSARHCYDLEVWMPGQDQYREIASISNCGDFQARRMALRYRPEEDKSAGVEKGGKKKSKKKAKTVFCHTMNGSGVAVGRALVAILENYQNEDGSISIPEALLPYMNGMSKIESLSEDDLKSCLK